MVRRLILASALLAIAGARADACPRCDPTDGRSVFTGASLPTAASAVTLNPAAMGLGTANEGYLGITGILEQFGIDRRIVGADGSVTDAPKVDDLAGGLGFSAAFVWHPARITTLGAELRLPPPELFPNDPSIGYFSRGSYQYDLIASGGVSVRVSSAFLFGVSVSHDDTFLRLKYNRDLALDRGPNTLCGGMPCGFENPSASERYDIDVSSHDCGRHHYGACLSTDNISVNVGILLHPTATSWFGLAYHNTPGFGIQSQLDGPARVRHAPIDGGAKLEGNSTVLVSYPASVDGELRLRVLPDVDAHLGGKWIDLSRMQSYDVRVYGNGFLDQGFPEWVERPRGFHDAFGIWAGAEQVELDQRKRIRIGGRLGYETPSLSTRRTAPGNMSPSSLTLDVGGQLRISHRLSLQVTYGLQAFATVNVTHSDYNPLDAIDCANSGFDYSTPGCASVRNGYAIPSALGDYSRLEHAVRIGVRIEP